MYKRGRIAGLRARSYIRGDKGRKLARNAESILLNRRSSRLGFWRPYNTAPTTMTTTTTTVVIGLYVVDGLYMFEQKLCGGNGNDDDACQMMDKYVKSRMR